MVEAPLPADGDRSLHARFPWAPAAICAASIAMAAWMWIGYSYCWQVEPSDLNLYAGELEARDVPPDGGLRMLGRYVCVQGIYHEPVEPISVVMGVGYGSYGGPGPAPAPTMQEILQQQRVIHMAWIWNVTDDRGSARVVTRNDEPPSCRNWEAACFRGRVALDDLEGTFREPLCFIDTDQGRLSGESVAGLVVAAFATFVFALYLRRWLRDRSAAATA